VSEHVDVDAYVDGELGPEADRHVAGCSACRAEVEAVRRIVAAARALPREMPAPDAWPAIEARIRPRRWWPAVTALGVGTMAAICAGTIGLAALSQLSGGPDLGPARDALARGDLPEAGLRFAALVRQDPTNPEIVEGAAYAAFLKGDEAEADRLLAGLPSDPDVEMRRAIVALRGKNLDAVRDHGERSGLPAGLVLAAEVHLADAEEDLAVPLLERAAADPGMAGITAKRYLALIQAEGADAALAEATALWAVGEKDVAVDFAAPLLVEATGEDRDEQRLMWAGRAVTAGRADTAETLLDAIEAPPEGQAWRVHATRALVAASRGDVDGAAAIFEQLDEAGAPTDGMGDARATAVALCRGKGAERLIGGTRGVAAARALEAAGSPVYASVAPVDSAYGRYSRGD
jgi:hypothetical protein